jgi:tRNA threonylcarbamoyladenosine biosynthesis protein TsaE
MSPDVSLRHDVLDEAGTVAVAEQLATLLPEQLILGLVGTLGAGKTRFAKAFAAALGVAEDQVTSPTFVMWQTYHGSITIHHVDAYRIADEDEWYELGLDEKMDEPGIMLIEWSDRFAHLLPNERLDVHIEPSGETSRSFAFHAVGDRAATVVRKLQNWCLSDRTGSC